MARPRDLIKGERNRPRLHGAAGLFMGEVRESASSPTDEIELIVPAFSREKRWGPCSFMPRVDEAGETVLPSAGDPCAVALFETGDPGMPESIIVWWEPS